MLEGWIRSMADLLEAPSPAVLTTYRKDGTAFASPVWFRFHENTFEVVVAQGDVKLRHLERRPECSLVVFETVPPFRGVRVEGEPTLSRDVDNDVRMAVSGRFLGVDRGRRFAERRQKPGVVIRLGADRARAWDLSGILPAGRGDTGREDVDHEATSVRA